jgi:hypothetical protein
MSGTISTLPASQQLAVTLNGQNCTINIYTRNSYGFSAVYLDLYVSGTLIIGGVICENLNPIVRDAYLGFIGDLYFYDTQGTNDPTYDGIGTRYLLIYAGP